MLLLSAGITKHTGWSYHKCTCVKSLWTVRVYIPFQLLRPHSSVVSGGLWHLRHHSLHGLNAQVSPGFTEGPPTHLTWLNASTSICATVFSCDLSFQNIHRNAVTRCIIHKTHLLLCFVLISAAAVIIAVWTAAWANVIHANLKQANVGIRICFRLQKWICDLIETKTYSINGLYVIQRNVHLDSWESVTSCQLWCL